MDRLKDWRTTSLGILGAGMVAYCGASGGHLADPHTWVPAVLLAAVGWYLKHPSTT